MPMRVFGVSASLNEDEDYDGLAETVRYNAYIDSVRPNLPATVSSLLDVSVHDALVVKWSQGAGLFDLTFVAENSVEGISRISLRFTGATVVANDSDPVETLDLTAGSTVLLTSEFDVLPDNRFRYQVMLTPEVELAISFSGVTIDRSPATREEYDALGNRPASSPWASRI
jgi:hypothetical protein